MKLSLCITTYNRYELTIESCAQVLNDDRIDDIVILDDASTDGSFIKLVEYFAPYDKVKVDRQSENVGMSRNKRDAIEAAKNNWCILFDSDNIIGPDYLDAFYKDISNQDSKPSLKEYQDFVIFCPDFAKPHFDYTKFSNRQTYPFGIFDQKQAKKHIHDDMFNCLMNTCNYIVNKNFYLSVYKYNEEHIASDTIWHNYNHLKRGGVFRVVDGMQYFHRVHEKSGFREKIDYNMIKANEVRNLIQQL